MGGPSFYIRRKIMDILRIDDNFQRKKIRSVGDFQYYKPAIDLKLYGLFYEEKEGFFRIPPQSAQEMGEGVAQLSRCTAGGRVRFATDSPELCLRVHWCGLTAMPHMPLTGSAGFVLLDETTKPKRLAGILRPEFGEKEGFVSRIPIGDGSLRQYIMYFPLYNDVFSVEIGLRAGSAFMEGKSYESILPILYYGSSITQGGCASRADNSYQALLSEWTNIDFFNFGFSGRAKGEERMAEYLATIPSCLFVMDYDHNADSAADLERTHEKFYAAYRRHAPQVPVLFVSKPDIEQDGAAALRRDIIYATYQKADRAGENVFFLDGAELFGNKDRWHCTVDGTHPNDLGFYRMACALHSRIASILGI